MDVQLRSECQSLLEQLRTSQKLLSSRVSAQTMSTQGLSTQLDSLSFSNDTNSQLRSSVAEDMDPIKAYDRDCVEKKSLKSNFGKDITSDVNVSKDAFTDLKPTMARNKLSGLARGKQHHKDKENAESTNESQILSLPSESTSESPVILAHSDDALLSTDNIPSSWSSAAPYKQQQRQLIDRHTSVPTKLNDAELKELDNERNLNFNYAHINVDDNVVHLKSDPQVLDSASDKSVSVPVRREPKVIPGVENHDFNTKLNDDGNSRKLGKLITEATIKPKTILNSTSYYSLNSSKRNNTSKVRFNTSRSGETTTEVPDQRLLGYDWIAALLDNDPVLMDQSESFFDDLRDFRRAHKDECSNQFYMAGPHTLVDLEPPEVAEALTEPKVRPYIVNERLFTEPFKSNLIPNEDYDAPQKSSKEPTKDNPRFVRVSIPRSTLQTPHRVKPHRRKSFDAADSCALMEHCLLGWENTRPEMLPAAKSMDLNTEAGTRTDSVVTSLAEAERLATAPHHGAWPFSKPQGRLLTLPSWRKHYRDTTLNMTQPSLDRSGSGSGGGGGKRATDRLLQATYSNMYEMERLKQERELELKREEKERKKL